MGNQLAPHIFLTRKNEEFACCRGRAARFIDAGGSR